jgi:ABC-type uncharacterized transport system permease subunit
MNLEQWVTTLSLLSFAIASVFYLLGNQSDKMAKITSQLATICFAFGTLLVTYAVILLGNSIGIDRLSGLLMASAIAWIGALLHVKYHMPLIGTLVAPLNTFILLIQFFVAPTGEVSPFSEDSTFLIITHVALSIFGQAFAVIACTVSVFYLWEQSLLKRKLLDQIPKNLPAIDSLDRLLMICLWLGFIFITFGLITGAFYSQLYVPRSELKLQFKVMWAITVWIWYLSTILARGVFNKPGKRIAQLSLGGFALLATSYFGIGFFQPPGGM